MLSLPEPELIDTDVALMDFLRYPIWSLSNFKLLNPLQEGSFTNDSLRDRHAH